MKLLFVIPHYFNPAGKQGHGSAHSPASKRIQALTESILSLHQLFGRNHCEIDILHKTAVPADTQNAHTIQIIVCTTGENHLISELPFQAGMLIHHPTRTEPLMLGFECHRVLQEHLGEFDYYGFLEDDLVIQDGLFFEKLNQFNRFTEIRDLLQPNRFEISAKDLVTKAYVDGDIRPGATTEFQDIRDQPTLKGQLLGLPVQLRRPLNPHSGCFFLNQAQMYYWTEQPHFLDRDIRFISPLESAASLGIMKTFRIYKPAREYASFFEIRHADNRFIQLIGNQVAISTSQTYCQIDPF